MGGGESSPRGRSGRPPPSEGTKVRGGVGRHVAGGLSLRQGGEGCGRAESGKHPSLGARGTRTLGGPVHPTCGAQSRSQGQGQEGQRRVGPRCRVGGVGRGEGRGIVGGGLAGSLGPHPCQSAALSTLPPVQAWDFAASSIDRDSSRAPIRLRCRPSPPRRPSQAKAPPRSVKRA